MICILIRLVEAPYKVPNRKITFRDVVAFWGEKKAFQGVSGDAL